MTHIKQKITTTCSKLQEFSNIRIFSVDDLQYMETGYKTDNTFPTEGWDPIGYCIGANKHYWIKGSFKTPAAEEGYTYLLIANTGSYYGWDCINPQGLLYLNGKMVHGLDYNHVEAVLEPDTEYELHNYFYTGKQDGPMKVGFNVIKRHNETDSLYYDMHVPCKTLDVLNENTSEYVNTLSTLEQAANLIDFRAPHSKEYYDSIKVAKEFMRTEFYEKLCSTEGKPVVHCIGHTHIDVEWQWARNQTREKIQRSFSTANSLMKQYPEYLFTLSQPELYRYLKEEAPEKYEELKTLVKENRWEPEGAMWLECDCNLSSGESFIRQIMHGKQFFRDEFDKDSKVLFLPDVFGYSSALPQILKKSGIDYFVTSKISWNDTNQLPVDSFMWQGIDGTEIYSSFITAQRAHKNHVAGGQTTYVAFIEPSFVLGSWDRYQQKEYNTHTIMAYGYGDGGGGPTRDMLEMQRRLEKGLPGLPVTKHNFLLPALQTAEKEFKENCKKLRRTPRWVGELYLEYHRGTYTSVAKIKRANRKSEFALQKTESISMADMFFGGDYDGKVIDANWKKVLHNQFHDILPGSSIKEVYEGTDKDYMEIEEDLNNIIDNKLNSITRNLNTKGGVFVYNPSGFARKGNITVNGKTVELKGEIPSIGWNVTNDFITESDVKIENLTAENKYYKLTLDECGRIVSLFDKLAIREVVKAGEFANEFQLFEDYPFIYDNWEISSYYKSKMTVLDTKAEIEPIFDGSRSGFKVTRKYMDSLIEQKIWLYSEGKRIDFENNIDWQNKHQIFKIAFPFDVHTEKATYEIQFGHVERPTHSNTSWDEAKFEVCAHKWVDLSENGYGVTLLNDCKYGFNVEGTTLKLTALKSGDFPDPDADVGHHEFIYSLVPHSDTLYNAGVINEAYALNQPMQTINISENNGNIPESFSLVTCSAPNIIIETVKKAQYSDDMVVRIYDAFDSRTVADINVPIEFQKVYLCDMLENKIEELELVNGTVSVPVKNFEIVTLLFER